MRHWQALALAATAALTAAWIVGGFYYQLAWPLATKALVLVAPASCWARSPGSRRATRGDAAAARRRARCELRQPALVPVGHRHSPALVVVIAANVAIWQKEDLIANGRRSSSGSRLPIRAR